MFSGKTEEIIRRIKDASKKGLNVAIFKPIIDTRNPENEIISHVGTKFKAISVTQSNEILQIVDSNNYDVIGIDEAQFFERLLPVIKELQIKNKKIIVTGLDMDSEGRPFGDMPYLAAISDECIKLHGKCVKCGERAYISHRKTSQVAKVLIGGEDIYEALCWKCHFSIGE